LSASRWSRYALVLVDLQRDFWIGTVAATAPELPDRVAAVLASARAEGLTVVHVRARFRPDGFVDVIPGGSVGGWGTAASLLSWW